MTFAADGSTSILALQALLASADHDTADYRAQISDVTATLVTVNAALAAAQTQAILDAGAITALKIQIATLLSQLAILMPAQPSGPGITRWQDLPVGPNRMQGPTSSISFPAQTVVIGRDFAVPANYPVFGQYTGTAAGLLGCGVGKTVLTIEANSMSAATVARIPAQPTVSNPVTGSPVNPLTMLRVDKSDISNLTILGTPQQGLYNGVVIYQRTGAKVTDVLVKGIPGNSSSNPGETFSINDYKSTYTTLTRVEIDGTDGSGKRVAASGVGVNASAGFTTVDCYAHDMGFGAGFTHYMTTGTISHTRTRSINNVVPFNFERCVGVINLDGCTFGPSTQAHHAIIDSDQGSARVTITEPVYAPINGKFVILIHSQYWGQPQKQLASDITLIIGGVPRPDLLAIVSA